jgi:hypothetical protein
MSDRRLVKSGTLICFAAVAKIPKTGRLSGITRDRPAMARIGLNLK